ncbi:hypothetical protein DFQ04_1863 [Algoriphagus boseongensis]|uniref:Uncharacterized protein n=1 Tax=Algoriphagus boseongensis TaxID=1442587 RepID=A0A4R6T422_9BACT|nr:hypothetical protein [Algoriphagus boseongensis]TDQ17211.1 hypothetical protein DFQ04_1863 [Algoriphagus boseongensis]
MITSIFTQKNVCAALGIAMAFTIVLKAKSEAKLAQHTARFETTKPTPQIGLQSEQGPEILQVSIYKTQKPQAQTAPEAC